MTKLMKVVRVESAGVFGLPTSWSNDEVRQFFALLSETEVVSTGWGASRGKGYSNGPAQVQRDMCEVFASYDEMKAAEEAARPSKVVETPAVGEVEEAPARPFETLF